jgi:hypothetical protein
VAEATATRAKNRSESARATNAYGPRGRPSGHVDHNCSTWGSIGVNADLDLLVSMGDYDAPAAVADHARRAESLGFSRFSVGETTGWNIVPVLTLVADRTDELGLSDDVISPFGRSPAMIAQTALTLHDVSDGRFRLGLGPSSPAITERWHGQDFERPLRRLRETIDVVRTIYETGSSAYEGELFDMGGLSYEGDVPDDPPSIDLATLGPKAAELTGRFADGWVPQLFTRAGLEDRLEFGNPIGEDDIQGDRLSRDQIDRLNQMARQQNQIRKQLQQLQQSGELEAGDKILSELERMADEMEKTINDLRGGQTDGELVKRQENILSRMLNAEKAMQELGEKDEREGTTSEDPPRSVPPDMTLEELQKKMRNLLNDPNQTNFSEDYQRLIEQYFELLKQLNEDGVSS